MRIRPFLARHSDEDILDAGADKVLVDVFADEDLLTRVRIWTLWTWIRIRPFLTRRAYKDILDAGANKVLVDAVED